MVYLVSTYGCSLFRPTEGVKWSIWYNIRMQTIKPTEGVKWSKTAPFVYVIDVMRNYRIYRITNYSHLKQKDYEHDFFS